MSKDQVFIRADLNQTSSGNTAYYRLDSHFRDFLNRIFEKHGDIEAVVLTKDEDGKYGFNIGFVIPKPKASKLPPLGHEEGEEFHGHSPVMAAK